MANAIINSKFQLRNDTKANWSYQNPILLKGEVGIEIDTRKFKIGDGVRSWSVLEYASSQPALLFERNPSVVDSEYDVGSLWINTASKKAFILYNNTTNNSMWKQIVESSDSDIPNLTLSKIIDAGTAASKNIGNAIGEVVVVNTSGKIDSNLLPSISITDVFEVSSQSEMLSLNAQQGDVAIRSDLNKSFILKQVPAYTLINWVELRAPTDAVLSVNGEIGAVTLTTSNISEGSNMYYTEARTTSNFNVNFNEKFPLKSSSELSDGGTILHNSDTLILNGGTSNGW